MLITTTLLLQVVLNLNNRVRMIQTYWYKLMTVYYNYFVMFVAQSPQNDSNDNCV